MSTQSQKELPYLKCEITEEDIKLLKKVFEGMENDKQAIEFLDPVDYVTLNIPDYPKIIKNPMDLGTAKRKLLNGEYNIFQDFLNDINLIWHNCKTYNQPGSDIVKMANHCEKTFKKLMDKYFKNYQNKSKNNNKNENVKLTMNEKIKLVEKIREQPNETLTQIIKMLLKEAPKAVEDIDNEKLQIKIDYLDHKMFDMINNLIETLLNNSNTISSQNKK